MTDAVGGYAIFTAEKVGAFDIELVDVLALILNLAVLATSMPGIRFSTSPMERSCCWAKLPTLYVIVVIYRVYRLT